MGTKGLFGGIGPGFVGGGAAGPGGGGAAGPGGGAAGPGAGAPGFAFALTGATTTLFALGGPKPCVAPRGGVFAIVAACGVPKIARPRMPENFEATWPA